MKGRPPIELFYRTMGQDTDVKVTAQKVTFTAQKVTFPTDGTIPLLRFGAIAIFPDDGQLRELQAQLAAYFGAEEIARQAEPSAPDGHGEPIVPPAKS